MAGKCWGEWKGKSFLINTRRMPEKIGHKLWFHSRSPSILFVLIVNLDFYYQKSFCVIRDFFLGMSSKREAESKQINEIEEYEKQILFWGLIWMRCRRVFIALGAWLLKGKMIVLFFCRQQLIGRQKITISFPIYFYLLVRVDELFSWWA